MTIEQFATLMNGVQSVLTSLALLVGGGWALYTFSALGQITRSRAELQRLELEQRKTEAEIRKLQQEAKVGAVIEISIKLARQSLPNDSSPYVSAVVQIENKGNRNTRLDYGESRKPLMVFAVRFNNDGALEYVEQSAYPVPVGRSPNAASPSILVRAGGRETIPFFFRVSSPGLYLVVFTAHTSEEEQVIAKELGFSFPGNWVAKEYFVVQ